MNSYSVDRNKWASFTIFEQMGNIYSEVGRSFKAKDSKDGKQMILALTRALDLFDATTDYLIGKKSYRTKEVMRSKEVYLNALFNENESDRKDVDRYFMQFAIAARLQIK